MLEAFFGLLLTGHAAYAVSPVQKVVELLDECKAKVQKDLDAEAKGMEEYTTFCDDELKDKGYAIETAGRTIGDLTATIDSSTANIGELSDATKVRAGQAADFQAAEKELVKDIDMLGRAATVLKRELSFAQTGRNAKSQKKIGAMVSALKQIVEAEWVDVGSKRKLKSFLQAAAKAKEDEDDDLSLDQPQAKQVAYESSSGGIVKTIEEMQGKAEDTLSETRKKEMENSQAFQMLEQGLSSEIGNAKSKLAASSKLKAEAQQSLE